MTYFAKPYYAIVLYTVFMRYDTYYVFHFFAIFCYIISSYSRHYHITFFMCVCVYIYMSVCVFHILCTVYYMVGALGHFRVPFRGGLTGGV